MCELRAETIMQQGIDQFLNIIELSLPRITNDEKSVLFDVKVSENGIMWPAHLSSSSRWVKFTEEVTDVLTENILNLPGNNKLPTDEYEWEAVRCGISKIVVGLRESEKSYPHIYLLASAALARILKEIK